MLCEIGWQIGKAEGLVSAKEIILAKTSSGFLCRQMGIMACAEAAFYCQHRLAGIMFDLDIHDRFNLNQ